MIIPTPNLAPDSPPTLRALAANVSASVGALQRAASGDSNDAEIEAGHNVASDALRLVRAVFGLSPHGPDDLAILALNPEQLGVLREALAFAEEDRRDDADRNALDHDSAIELLRLADDYAAVQAAITAQLPEALA